MKIKHLIVAAVAVVALAGCSQPKDYGWIKVAVDRATVQLLQTAEEIGDTPMIPRSIWAGYDPAMLEKQLEKDFDTFKDSLRKKAAPELLGKRRLAGVYDWTSGFYPGSLWYLYEFTGNEAVREAAVKFTNLLFPVSHYTQTHDLGFMINCSYGNAHRLMPCDTIPEVLVRTADNLCSRFNKEIGCIRSWDFGAWNFPVIIDNMMNLDLLFAASKITGNPYYGQVAVIHANTTMENHFREDVTSYHVVSYNPDGSVECKQTYQGKADDSAWARGQAWGVYGYTAAYRETGDKRYLDHAVKIADMIMSRVTTEDAIPYWDYHAPEGEDTPRDASAAAVTACGLLELSTFVEGGKKYYAYAEKILKSLSSDAYLAAEGTNEGFVLMHSTGSLPHGSEVDVPLNYADYYYLEGLQRYMALEGIKYADL